MRLLWLTIVALSLTAHAGDCALLMWMRGNLKGFPTRLVFLVACWDFVVAVAGLMATGMLWLG